MAPLKSRVLIRLNLRFPETPTILIGTSSVSSDISPSLCACARATDTLRRSLNDCDRRAILALSLKQNNKSLKKIFSNVEDKSDNSQINAASYL